MVEVRRSGDALGTRKLHSFQSGGKRVFEKRSLVWGKFSEHMADHVSGLATADADLEAREGIGAEMFEHGLDAVVASSGTFFAETKRAEWQGGIVINDEQVFR